MTLGVSAGAASLTISMRIAGHASPELGDFTVAFLVVAACAMLSTPISMLMPRHAATEVSGHVQRG